MTVSTALSVIDKSFRVHPAASAAVFVLCVYGCSDRTDRRRKECSRTANWSSLQAYAWQNSAAGSKNCRARRRTKRAQLGGDSNSRHGPNSTLLSFHRYQSLDITLGELAGTVKVAEFSCGVAFRAWQSKLVGGVLVERTVAEVLPAVRHNLEKVRVMSRETCDCSGCDVP